MGKNTLFNPSNLVQIFLMIAHITKLCMCRIQNLSPKGFMCVITNKFCKSSYLHPPCWFSVHMRQYWEKQQNVPLLFIYFIPYHITNLQLSDKNISTHAGMKFQILPLSIVEHIESCSVFGSFPPYRAVQKETMERDFEKSCPRKCVPRRVNPLLHSCHVAAFVSNQVAATFTTVNVLYLLYIQKLISFVQHIKANFQFLQCVPWLWGIIDKVELFTSSISIPFNDGSTLCILRYNGTQLTGFTNASMLQLMKKLLTSFILQVGRPLTSNGPIGILSVSTSIGILQDTVIVYGM